MVEDEGTTETGLYVTIPVSSYAPTAGTDGFQFTSIAPDIFSFTRRLRQPTGTAPRRSVEPKSLPASQRPAPIPYWFLAAFRGETPVARCFLRPS